MISDASFARLANAPSFMNAKGEPRGKGSSIELPPYAVARLCLS
jgi:hypothetical protein